MKTEDLKKELISGIEKAFEKYEEKPKPEFCVGMWVIRAVEFGTPHNEGRIFRISDIDGSSIYENGKITHCKSSIRPATDSEIESHLKKIAIEKGFKEGVRYKNTEGGVFIAARNPELYMEDNPYSLECGALQGLIYNNKTGKWAKILSSKKKVPVTREEFDDFLNDIAVKLFDDNLSKNTRNNFLKDYDF